MSPDPVRCVPHNICRRRCIVGATFTGWASEAALISGWKRELGRCMKLEHSYPPIFIVSGEGVEMRGPKYVLGICATFIRPSRPDVTSNLVRNLCTFRLCTIVSQSAVPPILVRSNKRPKGQHPKQDLWFDLALTAAVNVSRPPDSSTRSIWTLDHFFSRKT